MAPPHRDVAGAGGNRQEEAGRHDHPQDLIQAYPGPGRDGAAGRIQLDPIKGRQLDHRAVFELGCIPVGAALAPGNQRAGRSTAHKLLQLLH